MINWEDFTHQHGEHVRVSHINLGSRSLVSWRVIDKWFIMLTAGKWFFVVSMNYSRGCFHFISGWPISEQQMQWNIRSALCNINTSCSVFAVVNILWKAPYSAVVCMCEDSFIQLRSCCYSSTVNSLERRKKHPYYCSTINVKPSVHVLPAKKLCAAWHDFKGEAFPSINTIVLLAVAAARHVTGGLGCRGGAGGSCRGHS